MGGCISKTANTVDLTAMIDQFQAVVSHGDRYLDSFQSLLTLWDYYEQGTPEQQARLDAIVQQLRAESELPVLKRTD